MLDAHIRQYGKRLYGLCLTLCANTHDAEDLYQDTWLKVLRYLDRYDPVRDFEPWLTTICVNTYRDRLRRIARAPLFASISEEIPAPERRDYAPLYAAIDRLPEKLRLTVILFYFQDFDLSSTAQVLQVPVGTIKSRLSRARKLLKEALQDETDLSF